MNKNKTPAGNTPPTQPINTSSAEPSLPVSVQLTRERVRQYMINLFVGALIAVALVSVLAIMTGGFTDTIGKTIATLATLVVHSLISLLIVWNRSDAPADKNISGFHNVMPVSSDISLFIVGASTLTSMYSIWDPSTSSPIVANLYATYFTVYMATLIGEMLYKTRNVTRQLSYTYYIGITATTLLASLLTAAIWSDFEVPDIYLRTMSSLGVIAATTSVLATIIYTIYMKNNPGFISVFGTHKHGSPVTSILKIIAIIFVLVFIVPSFIGLVFFSSF